MDALVGEYAQSNRRLILLDYDGTLRDFEPRPELGVPTAEVKQLLSDLVTDTRNTVAVISGRGHEMLEQWLGDLPLYFVAEHGMAYRAPGKPWQLVDDVSTEWQAQVRNLMEQATSAVPGSLIETKANSLVWHYRSATASPDAALSRLLADLVRIVKKYRLRVLRGDKSKAVDVLPASADKGSGARRWFNLDEYDFILAAGDDITDEDLFRAMPQRAFTVKVGEGETVAAHHQPDPASMRKLLSKLAASLQ